MIKRIILAVTCLFAYNAMAQDNLYLSTNKSIYRAGEQIRFDLTKFDKELHVAAEEYQATVDLVAPNGTIIQTKSIVRTEEPCYFFSLADSLKTGIYRLIANGPSATQAIKRVHVFGEELEELSARRVENIEYAVQGGGLIKNAPTKVAVRATDKNGTGVASKGTLKNSADSLVLYIDSDANGVASFEFTPDDSLYTLSFGQKTLSLSPQKADLACYFKEDDQKISIVLNNTTAKAEAIQVSVNDQPLKLLSLGAKADSTFNISKSDMGYGLSKIEVSSASGQTRTYLNLLSPTYTLDFEMEALIIGNNEQSEWAFEDDFNKIDQLSISVIDNKEAIDVDFYEEFYFDQLDLDLQLIEDRDFEAYLLIFEDQLTKIVNEERMNATATGGVLSYKEEYPYDQLSMLNLTTLRVVDRRNENISGIHDFESGVGKKGQIFPYHFTTYLQPIEPANFEEKVNYTYAPLKSSMAIPEKIQKWLEVSEVQKNINLSYMDPDAGKQKLPAPDYTYDLENYEVPNTMADMINYIVKYVSVIKNGSDRPELSMFRHMSTYKYRGSPLIFLNDLPVYDARTVLNLNPKDFAKVEVRNSYRANDHLGNFSLNGSISFFLKEGLDNPLEAEYKKLPVLEPCRNFNKKLVDNEYAPDFRHQLYWNPDLKKTRGAFWVDLISSDLSATYDVQLTAFMKDGTVIKKKSQLIVQ